MDARVLKQLKSGEYPIDMRLDLHGHTSEEAYDALCAAVRRAAAAGKRCVLVITGKGEILRPQVPAWLGQAGLRSQVLAVERAAPRHGGEGAYYVLLKKRRG